MKRLSFKETVNKGFKFNRGGSASDTGTGQNTSSGNGLKKRLSNMPIPKIRIPFSLKWFIRILLVLLGILLILLVISYFLLIRPVLNIASAGKELKASTYTIQAGLANLDLDEVNAGLTNSQAQLEEFKTVYEENMKMLRKLPKVESYYQDGNHLISVADETIQLGTLVVSIIEPYSSDLGFASGDEDSKNLPAQERVVKLLRLMPEFSPKVEEISNRMASIDEQLAQIDASTYPTSLPKYVSYFGIDPELNLREQILGIQSVSSELASKAPQFEAFFNAIPDFMGLNEPKTYLIIMANNYELRMAGGFNTYIVAVEFNEGIPDISYSIDTYFIDEGDRMGSSSLVNRKVPYHLRNYLYLPGNTYRWYARDATSNNADFPLAADDLLNEFWRKDRTLPQEIDGVLQINNDLAVEILKVVGPVNTEKYSIKTDSGNYITIPVTEFNSENVIEELENIAGGKLAQTLGRKEIIKFLGESILEKMYTSEATNLVNIANTMLDSLSRKDIVLYSFDPLVQEAFEDLGYGGRIVAQPEGWDYLHVNRSNYGSGKADWTKEGFVHQSVEKDVTVENGKKISTVRVTIHNPARPADFNIDPCCFYNAYSRIYVPQGSKMISVTASDGQDPQGAEFLDETLGKTYIESYTKQQKETDLTVTYVYELPDTVDLENYNLLLQRQPGSSIDPYTIKKNGIGQELLLNADKEIAL